jgi:hypothetical protein
MPRRSSCSLQMSEHEEIRWRAEAALERLDQHNAR